MSIHSYSLPISERQRGFALIELTIAVLIATLLAVWAAQTMVVKVNDAAAQSAALWMLSVRKAVHAYLEKNAGLLSEAQTLAALSPNGYADWSRPTILELKGQGLLSAGFPTQVGRGLSAKVLIMRSGSCPGIDCRFESLVYSDRPLSAKSGAEVDEHMLAQWTLAAQGFGGIVSPARPGVLSGAAFSYSNPPTPDIASLPVGTVAMAITAEQLGILDFLRVRDKRDPDFQASLSVAGNVDAKSSLRVQDYLTISRQEHAYVFCEQEGAVAGEVMGGLLVCRNRVWRSAGRGGGGGFMLNTRSFCADSIGMPTGNPVTGACSCPSGTAAIRISDSGPATEKLSEGRSMGYLCVEW